MKYTILDAEPQKVNRVKIEMTPHPAAEEASHAVVADREQLPHMCCCPRAVWRTADDFRRCAPSTIKCYRSRNGR